MVKCREPRGMVVKGINEQEEVEEEGEEQWQWEEEEGRHGGVSGRG